MGVSEGEAEISNSDDDEVSGDVRWKTRLVDVRPSLPCQPAVTEEHIHMEEGTGRGMGALVHREAVANRCIRR